MSSFQANESRPLPPVFSYHTCNRCRCFFFVEHSAQILSRAVNRGEDNAHNCIPHNFPDMGWRACSSVLWSISKISWDEPARDRATAIRFRALRKRLCVEKNVRLQAHEEVLPERAISRQHRRAATYCDFISYQCADKWLDRVVLFFFLFYFILEIITSCHFA